MSNGLIGDFVIPDDSGIIALVDPSRYVSFIGESWSLDQILERFRQSMVEQSLLIWSPGSEGNWRIRVYEDESKFSSYRNAKGSIRVSNEGLYLVSYDSLTMAAQYQDKRIPQEHERNNCIHLQNGLYHCTVEQLFSPEDLMNKDVFAQKTPHFSISITAAQEALDPWPNVRWLQL